MIKCFICTLHCNERKNAKKGVINRDRSKIIYLFSYRYRARISKIDTVLTVQFFMLFILSKKLADHWLYVYGSI